MLQQTVSSELMYAPVPHGGQDRVFYTQVCADENTRAQRGGDQVTCLEMSQTQQRQAMVVGEWHAGGQVSHSCAICLSQNHDLETCWMPRGQKLSLDGVPQAQASPTPAASC